jgi:hypothetical protein
MILPDLPFSSPAISTTLSPVLTWYLVDIIFK